MLPVFVMYIIPHPGRKHKFSVNRNRTSAESVPASLATAPSMRYTVL